MCLKKNVKPVVKKGYKLGEIVKDNMLEAYRDPMPIGEWMNTQFKTLCAAESPEQYESGFHIFAYKKDAIQALKELKQYSEYTFEKWQLFTCEYSGLMYEGEEQGIISNTPHKILIAARMKILPNPV